MYSPPVVQHTAYHIPRALVRAMCILVPVGTSQRALMHFCRACVRVRSCLIPSAPQLAHVIVFAVLTLPGAVRSLRGADRVTIFATSAVRLRCAVESFPRQVSVPVNCL